jgi:MEMO1 family protein
LSGFGWLRERKKQKMGKNRIAREIIIIISILTLSIGVAGLIFRNVIQPKKVAIPEISKTVRNAKEQSGMHKAEISDEKIFRDAVDKYPTDGGREIIGGIIPHHNLASFMLADFFSRLKDQEIETLIVLAPNHSEGGNKKAITGTYSWQTPFGTVSAGKEAVENLVAGGFLEVNEDVIGNEHAMTETMLFVNYYLSGVRVVPIILSKKNNLDDIKALSNGISGLLEKNDKTAVIASVDFSHYLSSYQAEEKDKETEGAIKGLDYQKIIAFDSDHLDSPAAVATLLMALNKEKTSECEVVNHTNSGKLLNDSFSKTTSYFEILFFK